MKLGQFFLCRDAWRRLGTSLIYLASQHIMWQLRWIARVLFVFSLVIAPWLIGSAEPHWHPLIVWPMAASFVAWIISAMFDSRAGTILWPVLLWPVLLGIAWSSVSLLPLPQDISRNTSDSTLVATASLYHRFADSDPIVKDGESHRWPISVHPTATVRQIAWLAMAASALFLAANLFRKREAILFLLVALSANGVALTLFAIVQRATWNGHMFWIGPRLPDSQLFFGPFVYHNQGANVLSLCLAALIGWCILKQRGPREELNNGTGHRQTNRLGFSQFAHQTGFDSLRIEHLWMALTGVCLLAGLLCSFSRGMVLCTLIGGAITAFAVSTLTGRTIRWLWLFLLGGVTLGLVSWVGMNQSVTERMASVLEDKTFSEQGRLDHWREGFDAARQHWLTGTGLGTYRYVIPMFHDSPTQRGARHAHNQYLETLVEGGVLSLVLVIAALCIVTVACFRLLRLSDPLSQALGAAGLFALLTQALHAVGDFCLILPANSLMFATLCGIVVARAQHKTTKIPPLATKDPPLSNRSKWLRLAPALFLLIACGWSCLVIQRHANIYRILANFSWATPIQQFSLPQVDQQIKSLQAVLPLVPGDAEGYEALGDLWMIRYRLVARKNLSEQTGFSEEDENLWLWTDPNLLYQRSQQFRVQENNELLKELALNPIVAENLLPARQALKQSAAACPLLPQTNLRLAALSFLGTRPEEDVEYLEKCIQLDPSNYDRLLLVGQLHYYAGRFEQAWQAWQKSLALSPKHLYIILGMSSALLDGDGLAQSVIPSNAATLLRAAKRMPLSARGELERQKILVHAEQRAMEMPDSIDRDSVLGSILAVQGRPKKAIPFLRKAARGRATDIELRFQLAQQLALVGKMKAAHREATYCMRMKPDQGKYERLHRKLSEVVVRSRYLNTPTETTYNP